MGAPLSLHVLPSLLAPPFPNRTPHAHTHAHPHIPCHAQVREIYETAIEAEPPHDLPDADVREVCLRYAALETKLGEIDRARAIYVHGSALSHPDKWVRGRVGAGLRLTVRRRLGTCGMVPARQWAPVVCFGNPFLATAEVPVHGP